LTTLRHDSPLRYLGLHWFAVVMGWSGLALAWLRGEQLFGETARLAGYACAAIAASTFVLILVGSVARIALGHLDALLEDIAHPVRHAFLPAVTVSVLLLSTLFGEMGVRHAVLESIWIAAAVLHFVATVWVVARWLIGGVVWPAMTPIMFIPVVGNVVVTLGIPSMGHAQFAVLFLGLGGFAWPLAMVLVLVRTAMTPLPARLTPTWFITVAPPAVIGIAMLNLGLSVYLAMAALGVAVFFATCATVLLPRILREPFDMPCWGMSFPLAALAGLGLALASRQALPNWVAASLLALATLAIVTLSVLTVRGLARGSLLVAERKPPASTS
jgi:tellurite resistance protein